MRLIDADAFQKQIAAMAVKDILPIKKVNSMLRLIDAQPTAIDGVLRDTKETYRRTVKVNPTECHYEEVGEEPYIKYICPVCEALGRRHQVNPVVQNCPVCGVQLYWGEK